MEGDEMEMTREELQKIIRERVNHRLLQTPEVMSKQMQLLQLWDRKEKLYTDLYKLFESVSKSEITVRQLYANVGWEYKDINTEDCNGSASNCGATFDDIDVGCASPASSDFTATLKEEQEEIKTDKCEKLWPRKELIVLLEKLPMNLRPRRSTCQKAPKVYSDTELSNSGSEYQPNLTSGDSDSDFSISSTNGDQHKRKKFRKDEKIAKDCHINKTNITNGTPKDASSGKTQTKQDKTPFTVTEATKPGNPLPAVLEEVQVGMQVVARRKRMRWESGKLADIVVKENGTKKYKVIFESKGKVLVSGHHIAYNTVPRLTHLSIGGRVLSKRKSDNTFFSPGILAELPSRRNHMRFLIFFDDQSASYVSLPVVRIICKPLSDPLDDIRDEDYKSFMTEYLKRMPYPPQTQFRIEQCVKVRRNGVMEACTVLQIDSSLMEVAYTKDNHKEWIYRGSMRLEHMLTAKENSN